MKRVWAVVAVVVALVVGAVVFVACQPGDDPGPQPTDGAPGPTSGGGMTTEEFEAAVLEGDVGTSEVLASGEGELTDPPDQVPVRVDVTEVVADETSTVVRFTLVHTGDGTANLGLPVFNQRAVLARDVRDVALVDPVAEQRYQPFIGVQVTDEESLLCACSTAPLSVSEGQLLTATFPPLDPGADTVTVEVPWLPAIEDVPVTRR